MQEQLKQHEIKEVIEAPLVAGTVAALQMAQVPQTNDDLDEIEKITKVHNRRVYAQCIVLLLI